MHRSWFDKLTTNGGWLSASGGWLSANGGWVVSQLYECERVVVVCNLLATGIGDLAVRSLC